LQATIGLFVVVKFEILSPATAAQCACRQVEILRMKIRTKSYIEKLLPEPQPNSEPLLIVLPSATLVQNALLGVSNLHLTHFDSFIEFIILKFVS
jgi:hypothetical protein